MNHDEHAAIRLGPEFFFHKARELAVSALLVAQLRCLKNAAASNLQSFGPDPGHVDFMLLGMSLECILKGGVIRTEMKAAPKDPKRVTDWVDRANETLKTYGHDLRKLAKTCGLDVTEQESVMLEDVTSAIVWRARYPVPLKSDKLELNDLGIKQWKALRKIVQRAAKVFSTGISLARLRRQLNSVGMFASSN